MKKIGKLVSLMLSAVLCLGMAAPAFAIEYKIDEGNVYVEKDEILGVYSYQGDRTENTKVTYTSEDKDIIITGTTKENTITVGENVTNTTITLRNVNIDVSMMEVEPESPEEPSQVPSDKTALSITGENSAVIVDLEGNNTLTSGDWHAGLALKDGASVTIRSDKKGSLTATGSSFAAGIGSECYGKAGAINISGSAVVKATGDAAGIGSGSSGTVGDINISDSARVEAASDYGTGIGSGTYGGVGAINISGSANVKATSDSGTSIGGSTGDINISGSAKVEAISGYGTSIGSGSSGEVGDINISDSASVKAISGYGTSIGSGTYGKVGNINICDNADVEAASDSGTGIGGNAGDINISGRAVVKATSDSGTGIGSGTYDEVGDINISDSAKVEAISGYGTGIGSGSFGTVGNINIYDNAVVEVTSDSGTGIGSGTFGTAGNINIYDNAVVKATSNGNTGIGSGTYGEVGDIKISGSAAVEATSSYSFGVGIGAGSSGTAGDIEISDTGTVTVTGNENAADIGGGYSSTTGDITVPCSVKNKSGEVARIGVGVVTGTIRVIHSTEVTDKRVDPTSCIETGLTEGTHCSRCGTVLVKQEEIPALEHTPGRAARENETASSYDEVVYCSVCNKELSRVTKTIELSETPDPETPDDPGTIIPDPDIPMVDGTGTDTAAAIADQEVPLAGLIPLHELLEALRVHEEIEEIELPKDFKWLNHEHAQAIYWALQEELVVDTEEEPLDPDENLTVGLMRKVLVNFVELYLDLEDFVFTLEGEDDELVMDLGERLTAFYAELEAFLKEQAA